MIVDLAANWERCFRGCPGQAYWRACFEFLKGLSPEIPDGRHAIFGEDVFGLVSSYHTRPVSACRFETHREHIDVQALLFGVERIGYVPAEGLAAAEPYHPERDVEFYAYPESEAALVTLSPGLFAAFFPWDGHMPQVSPGPWPVPVKKAVVKVRLAAVGG